MERMLITAMGRMMLTFYDGNQKKIDSMRLSALPICEDAQIEKSIEIYDDPAPCIIKRSAVSKLIYLQLMDCLNEVCASEPSPYPINEIPSKILRCFEFDNEAHFLDYED